MEIVMNHSRFNISDEPTVFATEHFEPIGNGPVSIKTADYLTEGIEKTGMVEPKAWVRLGNTTKNGAFIVKAEGRLDCEGQIWTITNEGETNLFDGSTVKQFKNYGVADVRGTVGTLIHNTGFLSVRHGVVNQFTVWDGNVFLGDQTGETVRINTLIVWGGDVDIGKNVEIRHLKVRKNATVQAWHGCKIEEQEML